MKEINLKAALAAYRTAEEKEQQTMWARESLERAEKFGTDIRIASETAKLEAARKSQKDAEEAFAEAAGKALAGVLDEVQKRCSARTVTPEVIVEILARLEDKLAITKKAMEGLVVRVDPCAQDFPGAYKYTPESTQFSARYSNGSWRVTELERAATRRQNQRIVVEHTEVSKAAILARYTQII